MKTLKLRSFEGGWYEFEVEKLQINLFKDVLCVSFVTVQKTTEDCNIFLH